MDSKLEAVKVKRKLKAKPTTKTRSTVAVKLPHKDDYLAKQDALHSATAKGASWLHLAGSALLGAVQTFFKRTFLSVVAGVTLIGGMSLSALGYAVSGGFIPENLMGGNSIRDTLSALVNWSSSAPGWELFGAGGMALLALVVQAYQSWSIYTIQNARNAGKTGGKPIFSSLIHRLLFWAVTGLVWYLDFQAIAGVSFAAGVAGIALWLWAAFPSEIAAMILQIQRSAKDE